jgi:hypothetical protein
MKRAKQKEAREQILKIKAARDEVRKQREIQKNELIEDDVDDDLVIDAKRAAFLKKRADEEELMKEKSVRNSGENENQEKNLVDQKLNEVFTDIVDSTVTLVEKKKSEANIIDQSPVNLDDTNYNVNETLVLIDEQEKKIEQLQAEKLAREANLSQTVLHLHQQPGVNTPSKAKQATLTSYALTTILAVEKRQEDEETITSKDRSEMQRFYDENIKYHPMPFLKGTELLDKMSDKQHKLFLNLILERLNISAERSLALNLHKKKKVITEELLRILHTYMAEDEGGDLTLLSKEEKDKLEKRVGEKLWDMQLSVYENPLSPVRDIVIKTTKELKEALVSDRVPAQQKQVISQLVEQNDYNDVRNRALFPTEPESKVEAKTDNEPESKVEAITDTNNVKKASDVYEEPTQEELNKDSLYRAFMAEDERKSKLAVDGQVAEVVMETPSINKPSKKVSDRELNSIKISKTYGQETHAILDPNSTRKRKGSENEDDTIGTYNIDF